MPEEKYSKDQLFKAAENGDLTQVKAILDENPHWNRAKNSSNETALLVAAEAGHGHIVKFLAKDAKITANVNAVDISGQTAMYLLADFTAKGSKDRIRQMENAEAIQALIDKGADVNFEDTEGSTPITAACYSGNISAVKILIANGADLSHKRNDGVSVKDAALKSKSQDVANYIQEESRKHPELFSSKEKESQPNFIVRVWRKLRGKSVSAEATKPMTRADMQDKISKPIPKKSQTPRN